MKRWTEKEIEKLLYLADAGFNNSKIAEVLGRTEYSIVSKLKNINYKREMVPKYRYKIGRVALTKQGEGYMKVTVYTA